MTNPDCSSNSNFKNSNDDYTKRDKEDDGSLHVLTLKKKGSFLDEI